MTEHILQPGQGLASLPAAPGDVVLVRAGAYPPFQLSYSGTSIAPIVIEPYGDGPARFEWTGRAQCEINGAYVQLRGTALEFRNPTHNVVKVRGHHNVLDAITVLDGGIDDPNPANDWINIMLMGRYNTLRGVHSRGAKGQGVYCLDSDTGNDQAGDFTVEGCIIDDCGGSGVQVNPHLSNTPMSGASYIRNNHIEHCGFSYQKSAIAIVPNDPRSLKGTIYIEGNTAIRCRNPENTLVQRGIYTQDADCELFIRGNYIEDNEVGVHMWRANRAEQLARIHYYGNTFVNNDADEWIGPEWTLIREPVGPTDPGQAAELSGAWQVEPIPGLVVEDGEYIVTIRRK